MNQNSYGQSERSSLSRRFLTNNKHCCVTGSIRSIGNLRRTQKGPVCCPAPVPAGSQVPAAGGNRGALLPTEKTPVSLHCVTHADLLLSPYRDFLHGNIKIAKRFATL